MALASNLKSCRQSIGSKVGISFCMVLVSASKSGPEDTGPLELSALAKGAQKVREGQDSNLRGFDTHTFSKRAL